MSTFHFGLLCLLLFVSLTILKGFEVDTGLDGTVQFQDSVGKSVRLYNDYTDHSLSVYWKSPEGDNAYILDIRPSSSEVVNTYIGHEFVAEADDSSPVVPKVIRIMNGISEYHFGSTSKRPASKPVPSAQNVHPAVKFMNQKAYNAMAKFRCLAEAIDIWFDDGNTGLYQGSLTVGKEMTLNSYEGHVFFFTRKNDKNHVLARHHITNKQVLYLIEDPDYQTPQEYLDLTNREAQFMAEYYNRTGLHWRHYYGPEGPRGPPVLPMWPGDYVGQKHHVHSNHGFWECRGSAEDCQGSSRDFELEVISTAPRAFYIKNFFSAFEADAIVDIGKPLLQGSTVGNSDGGGMRRSDTRTSRNGWISRKTSELTDTIFRRAADLLRIDERLLNNNENAEDLQIVRYGLGERYDAHHDWGVSGYPESRFITLLLYLNDQVNENAGGETAFPKGADGMGVKVHGGKGNAVLFYSLLEDGNGDDLSIHASLPVHEGEKWLANFWVWDPRRH